jgi:asparagine synthase (glutamine-hydrolysing)
MCGIAGWISYGRFESLGDTVTTMADTMACRGPDARGAWEAPHVALSHRRLAVIDLSHGQQPMRAETPDGIVVLVYSGEVYNCPELRRELGNRGRVFRGTSDTEVVLQSYLEWGSAAVERLNGMYAFAIWDGRDESLKLVRDRAGIKPLYIHRTPDGVLFGSEPKAILAHPAVEAAVGIDGFRELFSMVKSPRQTIWTDISEVEPGTLVTITRAGIREDVYWRLQTLPHEDDRARTVERVKELLTDTIARQLVSDVPIGVLLSGGIDSSSLTAVAAKHLAAGGAKVRSFSVDFLGQTDNFRPDKLRPLPDTPFVRDVVAHSATEHTDIVLAAEQLADPMVRERVVRANDFPLGHGDMDASLALLFENIRAHATVALCGESADELFGGYHQFFSTAVRKSGTFPWLAGPHLPQYAATDPRRPAVLTPEFERMLDMEDFVAQSYQEAVAKIDRLDGEDELEWTMRKINNLYLTRFVRILLDRQDRLAMAVGLEVRVPFSDHRLITYVYNAPWSLKAYDGREKSLLRGAMANLLPHSVSERLKSPYPSTQDALYAVTLQGQVRELLSNAGHRVFELVNRASVVKAAESPAGTDMYGRFVLERTLDIAVWMDMYRPILKVG